MMRHMDKSQSSSGRVYQIEVCQLCGEIQGMRDLVNVLEPFDNNARRRMLEWLIAYQAEIPVASIPSPSRGEDR